MSDGDRPKIILTEDDMGGPAQTTPVVQPRDHIRTPPAAQQHEPPSAFPTVPGVGAPRRSVTPGAAPAGAATAQLPAWLNVNTVRGRSLIAAAIGIAIGWALGELTGASDWARTATTKLEIDAKEGAWIAVIGAVFAIVYAGWEQFVAAASNPQGLLHVAKKLAPVGAVLGFASGFLAQFVYGEILESIQRSVLESGEVVGPLDVRFLLARAIGWGLFGMGMGAAGAVLIRSRQKLVNGLIGGAVGGALGGVVFHWVGTKMSGSEGTARLIGLLVVGVGIGLAIGLVETARREAWLNVVGGAMTGKEFIIYAADTKIGSDPKCEIVLIKDPAIQSYHFIINTSPGTGQQRRTLTAYQGCEVTIQGQPVAQHVLRDGDVIGVGTTQIRYSERTAQQPLTGSI